VKLKTSETRPRTQSARMGGIAPPQCFSRYITIRQDAPVTKRVTKTCPAIKKASPGCGEAFRRVYCD
jgi:hypothetical protein